MADRQADKQAELAGARQTSRIGTWQASKQNKLVTDRQAGRQAGIQTGRQADRQAGKQADREADRDNLLFTMSEELVSPQHKLLPDLPVVIRLQLGQFLYHELHPG